MVRVGGDHVGGALSGTQVFMDRSHFQQKAHPSTFYSAILSPWFLPQSHKIVAEALAMKQRSRKQKKKMERQKNMPLI